MTPDILLRYFDCRGRAQPLRNYLAYHKQAFTDERVSFTDGWESWLKIKNDPLLSGPMGQLPVLQWAGQLHWDTRVISVFLQQSLDPLPEDKSIDENLSTILGDLHGLYELLNLDLVRPADVSSVVALQMETRLTKSLGTYELEAGSDCSPFVNARRFTLPAFWLMELVKMVCWLFPARGPELVDRHWAIRGLMEELGRDPGVQAQEKLAPTFWTARPDEPARVETLLPRIS